MKIISITINHLELLKKNSQFKEAKKLNAEYLINADEDTIKNLITNETETFDIEVILEH